MNKGSYYAKVGIKIKQQRVRYCLTEDELCSMIPISIRMYEAYELGTIRIPEYDLYILAEFYGIDIVDFMPLFKECNIFWQFDKNTGFQLKDGNKYRYDKRNTPRMTVEVDYRVGKYK